MSGFMCYSDERRQSANDPIADVSIIRCHARAWQTNLLPQVAEEGITPPDMRNVTPAKKLAKLSFFDAEEPKGLAKCVEGPMCQDEGHDVAPPKPQVKGTKCKSSCTSDKGSMDPLIVSMSIAEEG